MAKFKFKDAAMTAVGATGGAYIADFVNDKVDEMIDDTKMEIGAKLLLVGIAAYTANSQKGMIRDAAVSALGQFGKGIAESARNMMSTSEKPTKGIDVELQGIYDEIEEAMRGNDVSVTGDQNSTIVTGADYTEEEGD